MFEFRCTNGRTLFAGGSRFRLSEAARLFERVRSSLRPMTTSTWPFLFQVRRAGEVNPSDRIRAHKVLDRAEQDVRVFGAS